MIPPFSPSFWTLVFGVRKWQNRESFLDSCDLTIWISQSEITEILKFSECSFFSEQVLQVKLKRAFPYNLALILCWSVICPSVTQFFLSSRWEEKILGTSKLYQDIKVLMIFCETYRTIPRYAQDMSKICPRYTQDMPEICRRYARDMQNICQRYTHSPKSLKSRSKVSQKSL